MIRIAICIAVMAIGTANAETIIALQHPPAAKVQQPKARAMPRANLKVPKAPWQTIAMPGFECVHPTTPALRKTCAGDGERGRAMIEINGVTRTVPNGQAVELLKRELA